MNSCPYQRAITEVSTPALKSSMAAVCLSTCGEIRFCLREGHRRRAAAACLFSRYWMASGLSLSPWLEGKRGWESCAGSSSSPRSQCRRAMPGQRCASLFASLADAPNVCPFAQRDGLTVDARQLGETEPGQNGKEQQSVVTASDPSALVWCGNQGLDLRSSKKRNQCARVPFRWYGQYTLDVSAVRRLL